MTDKSLQHFGVLGMHWGQRKSQETQAILDRSNKILNNPKSTEKQLAKALIDIGVDPVSGKVTKTAPQYDKQGNDISVNPYKRIGKKKGQTDKEFDKEIETEIDRQVNEQRASDFVKKQGGKRVSSIDMSAVKTVGKVIGAIAVVGVAQIIGNSIGNKLMQLSLESTLRKYGISNH